MAICIRAIETAVPPTALAQSVLRDLFAAQPLSRLGARLVHGAFDGAQIDRRHTVIAELDGAARPDPVFYDPSARRLLNPSTGTRNAVYTSAAPTLFVPAARRALAATGDLGPDDVTHVVTVSCTGFYAPGPDYTLVRELGLSPSVQRYHLGFMGCYAAVPALRAAQAFCAQDPAAVVLVVSVELCTVHLATSDDPDTIVASAVFADGAGAAVVTARPAPPGNPVLELDGFESTLTPVGEQDMAWTIGDHGFAMVLSRYVPHIIGAHILDALAPVRAAAGLAPEASWSDIELWAVHPGGRAILDEVQHALDLAPDQLADARAVLREFGNMSSATVLFVLRRMLRSPAPRPSRVCALAFGPGLTVESAMLTRRDAA
ncbi:MAG: type III polyketide synthase [Cellulomonadaceae bacterium]